MSGICRRFGEWLAGLRGSVSRRTRVQDFVGQRRQAATGEDEWLAGVRIIGAAGVGPPR